MKLFYGNIFITNLFFATRIIAYNAINNLVKIALYTYNVYFPLFSPRGKT